jgi:general stress protein CsbA
MSSRGLHPATWVAIFVAYVLALYGALGRLPHQPAHEVHLVFAEHFVTSFFSLYDNQWFDVSTMAVHPPLAHQLVALTSHLPFFNVERAYAVWTVLGVVGLLFSVVGLARNFTGSEGIGRTALIVATLPPLFASLFIHGQLPFLLGLTFALAAISAGFNPAIHAGWMRAGIIATLGAAALSTHPAAITVLWLAALRLHPKPSVRPHVEPFNLLGLLGAGLLATAALAPFLELAMRNGLRPVSMSSQVAQKPVEALIATALVLVCLFPQVTRSHFVARILGAAGLALIGLAFFHRSGWIHGCNMWLLSGVVGAVGLGCAQASKASWQFLFPIAMGAAQVLLTSTTLGHPPEASIRTHRQALLEIAAALNKEGANRWRYATIGLGSERYQLARMTRTPSLDGIAPWLRLGVVADTPFASIDEIPIDETPGFNAVQKLLHSADVHALRWVVSRDRRADQQLEASGFLVRSAFKGLVVLWEREKIPPPVPPAAPPPPNPFDWAFCLLPVGCLTLAVILLAWAACFPSIPAVNRPFKAESDRL